MTTSPEGYFDGAGLDDREPPSDEELCGLVFDPDSSPPDGWAVMSDTERRALLGDDAYPDGDDDPLAPAAPEALEAGFTHGCGGNGVGFAAGGPLDVMLPGPELAWHAEQAWGRGPGELSDDELCGLLQAARRGASRQAALELAAVAELTSRRAGLNGRPGEHTAQELAALLTLTGRSAERLLGLAGGVARLPGVAGALADGQIDLAKAAVFADELMMLDDAAAAAIAATVIGEAPAMTTGQLRARLRRQVEAYDPQAARHRRERAEKDARVETWAEPAGTAALAGRDLAPADVIAADKNLDADARWLKAHGLPGSHDQLRAAALIARLTGQFLDSLVPGTGSPGWAAAPGGSVHLVMPAAAWLGRSDAPGEIPGYGTADAATCRQVAAGLARQSATRWCLTLVNQHGRAIAHGCARAGPGPPGAGDPAAWLAAIKAGPVEAGTCAHRRQSASYQPPDSLRHIVKIRSRRCGFPGCRRPATGCDNDHTIPHHQGGKTCECNLHPLCRRHHQTKQAPGWRLDQPQPGLLTWTMPSGRRITVTPEPYPCSPSPPGISRLARHPGLPGLTRCCCHFV